MAIALYMIITCRARSRWGCVCVGWRYSPPRRMGRKGSRILPSWIGRGPWDGRFLRTMMISWRKALKYRSELWYFDDMIPELVRRVEVKGRYNTQLLQTIRMLKLYESKA